MGKNEIPVLLEIKNKQVKDEIEHIISSIGGFQTLKEPVETKNSQSYDLLILEIGDDFKRELGFARTLQRMGIAKDIFLTSSTTSSELLLEVLKLGVKGFFPQPINKGEFRDALLRVKAQKVVERSTETNVKKGMIIYILGSKGGVGTTTVAVNLAVSLAALENKPSVALIDTNILFGGVPLFLNLEPAFDWLEVIRNISRVDAIYLMSILSKHPSGIHVLPAPATIASNYTADPHAMVVLLKLMQTMFDVIIIDGGQSLDENAKAILKISDTILTVCMPDIPSIINIKRLLNTFWKWGYPHDETIEIIVNKVDKNPSICIKDIEENLNKKILCSLPNNYKICSCAINLGKPFCHKPQGKETDIQKNFMRIASFFQYKMRSKEETHVFRNADSKSSAVKLL